jgi:hypothetical protein
MMGDESNVLFVVQDLSHGWSQYSARLGRHLVLSTRAQI